MLASGSPKENSTQGFPIGVTFNFGIPVLDMEA